MNHHTILHARSDPQFTEHLRSVLSEANGQPHSVDIAVGYFYLSGFNQVADLLASRPGKVRIIIGRTDTPTREEIAAGYSPRESASGYYAGQNRLDENAARDATLDNVGRNTAAQPQDDASEAGIKSLARLIADGKVDVRAYVKDRMHAKAYIGYTGLESAPGTAIIDSTHFSAVGFTGNTELNYPVTHGGDIGEIRQWFERLWNESEPVSERVEEQLRNSWPLAAPEPYLIYLKVLYELYGNTLGEEQPFSAEPPVELTDYQQDAVAAGLAMLEWRYGCYIADVVGMGKTYIGAEILRQLRAGYREAGDPLIICREYSLDHVYRKADGIERIAGLLKQYQAARYKPGKYLNDDTKNKPQYVNIVLSGAVSQDDGVQDSEEALTIDLPHDAEPDSDELDREEEYITIREQSYPATDFDIPVMGQCVEYLG